MRINLVQTQTQKLNVTAEMQQSIYILQCSWRQPAFDRMTIDQVSSLVGMEIKNANVRRAVEEKYADQFVQDWLAGRIRTHSDVLLRVHPQRSLFQGAIVRWLEEKPDKKELQDIAARLIQENRLLQDDSLLFTVLDNELTVVIRYSEGDDDRDCHKHIFKRICNSVQARISLCLGTKASSPELLHLSLEAQRVYRISDICRVELEITTIDQLDIYSLLYLLPQGAEVEAYINRFIQPLMDYDKKHEATSLVETLQAFFNAKGNVRATAAELYTHYNTVVYRL